MIWRKKKKGLAVGRVILGGKSYYLYARKHKRRNELVYSHKVIKGFDYPEMLLGRRDLHANIHKIRRGFT